MPILAPADGPLLEQVLAASYDLWNDGLTPPAYARWWAAQLATPWGAAHLRRTALVERGAVLASAKEYWFDATLDGRPTRLVGIGAVFTQPEHRGKGTARALVEQLLERASRDGAHLALLFSEIGADYYARLGFTKLPTFDDEIRVAESPRGGAPATLVRAGEDRDLDAIAAMNAARAAPFRFHLNRDRDLIRYAVVKKRLLAGLSADGRRELQFFVAEEGASAVAYLVISATAEGQEGQVRQVGQEGQDDRDGRKWTIEECGDRDPSGARVGAMLQVLLAREPSMKRPRIRAWLPPGFSPPQVTVASRTPSTDVMMIRPLTPSAAAAVDLREEDLLYWRADVF